MSNVFAAARSRYLGFLPWLVLLVTLGITYHFWQIERDETSQRLQDDFDFRVHETSERITQRLLAYEQVLRGTQGLFAVSPRVTREEFHTYIAKLRLEENYSGIQGVGFSLIVPPELKDRHIAAIRKEVARSDISPYTIWPEGKRSLYTPVIYLEPFSGRNLRAFGYNMFSEQVRRSAMELTRDSGKASISGKVTLVQEAGQEVQAGFLMYLPVYKIGTRHDPVAERQANIIGWVYSPFRMGDLMQGILGERSKELDFEIYDDDEVNENHLMYDSDIQNVEHEAAHFQTTQRLVVAGHYWTLRVRSSAAFESQLVNQRSGLIALSGIGGSLLLTLAIWLLVNGRRRAYAAAREMNRELIETSSELRKSESRLRAIVENELVGIVTAEDRIIQWANPAYEKLLGYDKNELNGVSASVVFADEDAYRTFGETAYPIINQGKVFRTELEYKCKDGSHRTVDVSGGILAAESKMSLWTCVDVTERKLMEEQIKKERNFISTVINTAGVLVVVINREGAITRFNRAAEEFTGYRFDEVKDIPFFWDRFLLPEQQQGVRGVFEEIRSGKITPHYENYWVNREGNKRLFAWANSLLFDYENKMEYVIAVGTDITERKQAEAALSVAATAFESQEGMCIADANGFILRVNRSFTNITGYTAEDAFGKNPRMLKSGRHDANFYAAMWDSIVRTGGWEGEIWNRRKNGEVYPEHLTITAVKDKDGIVTNYVATLTDITQTKASADEIKHLAFYDPLTRLPNRRLLLDRLRQALSSIVRSGRSAALLFIDLDNFKILNDTLGHDIGDILLQQVAIRLESCVREGDTVARLGGDEFVVMLKDLSKNAMEAAEQTESVGNKILSTLNQPYQLATHEYHNTPSIGATLFNDNKQSIEDLLKQADIAMYQSKKAGRNNLHFFDPLMQETVNTRAALEIELRKAIKNEQFQLHYQIQVDGIKEDGTHKLLGAEALIRWIHPEHGIIAPAEFFPLAEETGLILPIGKWVLETACAQIKAWQENELTRDFVLSVNLSSLQFRQADFVAQVSSLVTRYTIRPNLLKLELTESLLLENVEDTIATMTALNKIGVQFSLDDFGTGYSSLQYLKRLPIHQLKIDQSFVRDLATDSSDRAIVRTIIAMANSLNINVIAEGVETEEQLKFLLKKGCTHYQGFLFSKPLPIEAFEAIFNPDPH